MWTIKLRSALRNERVRLKARALDIVTDAPESLSAQFQGTGAKMIWIYRGEGWAVPLVQFVALGAVVWAAQRFHPDGAAPDFFASHAWPVALALGAAGIFNVGWGLLSNHRAPEVAVDIETGVQRIVRTRHSFYFIPVEYWGALSIVGAAVCLVLMPA